MKQVLIALEHKTDQNTQRTGKANAIETNYDF